MYSSRKSRKIIRPVSFFLVITMMWVSLPYGYASAAIIGTERVFETSQGQQARTNIHNFLARKDVQQILEKQGIDAREAKQRVDSLTDAEAVRLAEQIENLPAGKSALGAALFIAVVVFLVFLITDIAGLTDVFSFIKK
jgi:hypothetical protein